MPVELCLQKVGENATANFDLIFIHGLAGDPVETWSHDGSTNDDAYWPKWFANGFSARIFALGYPSSAFVSWANKDKDDLTLHERAKTALEYLVSDDVGQRPLAIICHSLGGLLAKQILRTANDGSDAAWKGIATRTKLLAFIVTPHTGASLARLLHHFSLGFSSQNLTTLTNESGHLDELNEAYKEWASQNSVRTLAYYERRPYKKVIWVDQQSANPGLTGTSPIPLEFDHITACKPQNKDALIHRSISRHLTELFAEKKTNGKTITTGFPMLAEASAAAAIPISAKSISAPAFPVLAGPFLAPAFKLDDYSIQTADRRDLLQKLIDAGREPEYEKANELQNTFAQDYYRLGLHESAKVANDKLLAEVEQKFWMHIYQGLICNGASKTEIAAGIQHHVIDAICDPYGSNSISPTAVYRAIYFLTQQCHLSWNSPE